MASTSSSNVTEILPGLENFLRSMLNSAYLDNDHRQIAEMYLDKLDQYSLSTPQQSSFVDDQSLMNTDVISDEESDDFTDEEEQQTPTLTRQSSICETQLYDSNEQQAQSTDTQWYTDIPKHSSNERSEMQSQLSIPSSIIADGLLLTYDKNHDWIWRYYVLDDYDLICFPADKKSRASTEGPSDSSCSPLWVSDITNAKVHSTVIDQMECLCLYIGLAEAIYVRPADPNEIPMWLKAFRDASSAQKSVENCKSGSNVKTLSGNARRMFAQFNRKKGQIMSHLLDQMANVTGVDDKTRQHYELRGFLVISFDNLSFLTKYCTIVDGIFRIHKSRLSEQTEQQFDLNRCTLSFPEERTRDIQFALLDERLGKIFIRGNNIYSMGRLLNTLAKYVEIKGSSQHVFQSNSSLTNQSQPSRVRSLSHLHEGSLSSPLNIYRSASKLHEGKIYGLTNKRIEKERPRLPQQTYDSPKITPIDRNNNSVLPSPAVRRRTQTRSNVNLTESPRPPSPDTLSISSSRADPIFCIRSGNSSSSRRRTSTDYMNKFTNLFTRSSSSHQAKSNKSTPTHVYDIPITIDEDQSYDNVSKSDGIGKFRFVIPLNPSPRSAFTTIKPINSPSSSSSSTISSNSIPTRPRLMTAV